MSKYKGPKQRGHAGGSILGRQEGGGGYSGPAWDKYTNKKKKKKGTTEEMAEKAATIISKYAGAALGAYTGGGG